MAFENMLNTTADLYRVTNIRSPVGGTAESWAAIVTGIPCRIEPLRAFERGILGSRGVEVSHRIYCEGIVGGVTVNEKDEFRVGAIRYRVQAALAVAFHFEIEVLELRDAG